MQVNSVKYYVNMASGKHWCADVKHGHIRRSAFGYTKDEAIQNAKAKVFMYGKKKKK